MQQNGGIHGSSGGLGAGGGGGSTYTANYGSTYGGAAGFANPTSGQGMYDEPVVDVLSDSQRRAELADALG